MNTETNSSPILQRPPLGSDNWFLCLGMAILCGLVGQLFFYEQSLWGLAFYGLGIFNLLLTLPLARLPRPRLVPDRAIPPWYHRRWRVAVLVVGLAAAGLTYHWSADNTFRWYGVAAWGVSIAATLTAFWQPSTRRRRWGLGPGGWRWSWTALAVLGLILIGVWFRFWRLDQVPPEMTSDHVEKLLDVHDVLTGKTPIFFTRNTGREPWQFYWTAGLIRLFDLRTDFWALKLGAALVSLLTLPGVYLLGKELYGRWVGVWATFFCAVASWHVLISRISLRFPYNPAITVWSTLFLLRGLRYRRRNDFLLLGLSLGVGLQGYTAFRAMPLAVAVCWFLSWTAAVKADRPCPRLWRNALLTVLVALIVMLPLARYSLENPDQVWFRSFSRVSDPERPYQDPVHLVFLKNLRNLALMFHWEGDEVWVSHWRIDGPVLDPILGALLILGLVVALWRGLRRRDEASGLLLVVGGLLVLPSALSLAFPSENPSVVRTGGAVPVVMVLAALPVGYGLACAHKCLRRWRRAGVWGLALALALSLILINRGRIFVDYYWQYVHYSHNASEIGDAIDGFVSSGGELDNAYVKAWPHWVDTRGVGIEAGHPGWDHGFLEVETLDEHVDQARPRFYALNPKDLETLNRLKVLFPDGWLSVYYSHYPDKNFFTYYVPPR